MRHTDHTALSALRLRHVAKTVAVPLLHGCGALWLASRLGGRDRQIALNYHNVGADVFRRHLVFLRRHAAIVDLETFLADGLVDSRKPTVTITFDDGYASFVHEIIPIASAFDVPVAWFVPTGLVGTDEIFWFDRIRARIIHSRRGVFAFQGHQWKLRSWNREYVAAAISRSLKKETPKAREQLIAELAAQLEEAPPAVLKRLGPVSPAQLRSIDHTRVTVGSHSHTHPQLSQLDREGLMRELVLSKRLLEEWTQQPVEHFAFPSGDYVDGTIQAVREAGYVSAWTTEARFRTAADDHHRMPRIAIDDHATLGILAAKMTAGARWRAHP